MAANVWSFLSQATARTAPIAEHLPQGREAQAGLLPAPDRWPLSLFRNRGVRLAPALMELVIGLALIVFAWRLRHVARRPLRVDVHHHFHFHGGPGRRDVVRDDEPAGNVVRLPARGEDNEALKSFNVRDLETR